jgi:formate-dependent phosphoribosylglycinamide formyltransferase (GAR transformylase)
MDKALMKNVFMEHGVPTANFKIFTDYRAAQLFADQHGYPVIVKASDSSGSRGITKVCKRNEFQFAWDRAFEASRSKEIIVEEFLEGIEFGAQAFVHGDRVIAVFPHRDTVTPAPFLTPIGHSIPMALKDEQQNEPSQPLNGHPTVLAYKPKPTDCEWCEGQCQSSKTYSRTPTSQLWNGKCQDCGETRKIHTSQIVSHK